MRRREAGFTLIELMIAIALMVIISAALYFSLNGALTSWFYSRDEMCMQKILLDTMDRVINGNPERYGVKDALQIVSAGTTEMRYVAPWRDTTHSVATGGYAYDLEKPIKAGTGLPIAQVRLPESDQWKVFPVSIVDSESRRFSKAKLERAAPQGSELRFVFHPDPDEDPAVIDRLYWDEDKKEIRLESSRGDEALSGNFFGVEISAFRIRYYNNKNNAVTDREFVDLADLNEITGVEVEMEASLNGRTRTLTRFVSLRNAPMRTGYVPLKKGLRIHIPDSANVRTLLVTNLSGISDKDKLELEAVPRSGKVWRLIVTFAKLDKEKPVIQEIRIEYPPQKEVFMDAPASDVALGLNLRILDPEGLYDYDDDADVEDLVLMEGDVDLVVTEMDIRGAGLYLKP